MILDKTGTLTEGVFEIQKIKAVDISEDELIKIVAHAEYFSNHPISEVITKYYGKEIDKSIITNTKEIPGKGIKATIEDREVLIGNDKMMNDGNIKHDIINEIGTIVYVAINNKYVGYILISDKIKSDSLKTIKELEKQNINETIMHTGDKKEIGESIANELNITKSYTELLPNQKVELIEKIKTGNKKVAFVGDGVNDAPALAIADVGIAMGGIGSDAAIEAADIIIMNDNLSKIITAIKISKKTMKIVKQNIIISISIKVIALTLAALGFSTMWRAIFADVGVTIIAILNSLRLLK